jgi:hypothetical protein
MKCVIQAEFSTQELKRTDLARDMRKNGKKNEKGCERFGPIGQLLTSCSTFIL